MLDWQLLDARANDHLIKSLHVLVSVEVYASAIKAYNANRLLYLCKHRSYSGMDVNKEQSIDNCAVVIATSSVL